MYDGITNVIGYMGAIMSIVIPLPQIIKSFLTKRTEDLSTLTIIVFIANCCLWFVYGLLIHKRPVIVSNIAVIILLVMQLVLKIRYDRLTCKKKNLERGGKNGDKI